MVRWVMVAVVAFAPIAGRSATIDQIRAAGILHCGGSIRPGLAFPARDGAWHGLEVDICRAVAVAVLGAGAKFEFHSHTLSRTYEAIRQGTEKLSFLTASEILAQHLLSVVTPGRAVFYVTAGVLVPAASPAKRLSDLSHAMICGEPGTGPERALIGWFETHHLALEFSPFQESEEMLDAYEVGRCLAMVNETARLAAFALQAAAHGHPSRLLPDAISAVPLMASTGHADARWAAIVNWTVDTLLRAETYDQPGPGGGVDPLPLAGPALGLAPGWQAAVIAATGSYADIYRRNLGSLSPLDLPRGLNALWTEGGLMCPPFSE